MSNKLNQKEVKQIPKKINKLLQQKKNLKIINCDAGQGSFGQVVIAEDIIKKTQFAIKMIKIDNDFEEICQTKLKIAKEEADFLKNQDHPNIVKYVDQFQIGITYYIVMEKCEKNLQQVVDEFKKNNSFISKEQLVSYACQILSAIDYLHKQKCMLRDLTLKNILVDSFNQIKLCDFGLVKQIKEEMNSKAFHQSQAKGAYRYYPPEVYKQVVENKEIIIQDFNGDIWAFGVCFQLLSGGDINLMKYYSLEDFLIKDKQKLDSDLNTILLQILNYDQDKRIKSINELQRQFESIKKEIWTLEQADILYKKYLEQKNSNQLQIAFYFITLCCQISEQNDTFLFQQGYIQSHLKMFEAAIKSYQACLKINPRQYVCYFNLGVAYGEVGLFDKAKEFYKLWLQLNPQDFLYKQYLANAYYSKQMFQEAIQIYLQFLQLDSQHYNCNLNLGSAYYKIGNMDEAITYYNKCLNLKPNDQSSFICQYNLGNIYYKQGRYQEAIRAYQECQKLDQSFQQIEYSDEIAQLYKQCLESSYYNLGSAFKKINKKTESILNYKKCLEINEYHQNAKKQLEKLNAQNIK
ncbi:hypothetical protein ABPG74_006834 [Tetrahymena malaccensis]